MNPYDYKTQGPIFCCKLETGSTAIFTWVMEVQTATHSSSTVAALLGTILSQNWCPRQAAALHGTHPGPEASHDTTAAAAAGNVACATRATASANLAHRSDGRNPGKYIAGLLLSRHPQELVSQEEYDDLKPLSKLKTVAGLACSSDSCVEDHPRTRSKRVISIL